MRVFIALALLSGCGAPEGRKRGTTIIGTVVEQVDAAPYTYLRIKTEAGERWAAVPVARVAKNGVVTIANGVLLKDFDTGVPGLRCDVVFGTLEHR
jgi:hypothetical protein